VEHFRPKAAVRQDVMSDIERPGYYWLAYDWANLYLACRPCNQEYKGIYFPLADPAARWRRPGDELPGGKPEGALLIDPAENPEEHIDFDGPEIRPLKGSIRGGKTISVLELARSDLNQARRTHLEPHRALLPVLTSRHHGGMPELSPEDVLDICTVLATSVHPSAPFAGMMRAQLRHHFGDDLRLPLTAQELLTYARGGALPRA
ncbi:MAG: hypothetical protein KC431_16240, partial [Myxococcales bacterium]|nr:hypothetical protein [Myxococcales bacterium]